MTVATLAVAEWVPPDRRAATLSWALVGGPAAWIVGMPLLGAAAEGSWRHAWLAFPLVAGLLSAVVVSGRSGAPPAKAAPVPLRATLAAPGVGGWLAAEVLANTAWAGTLVFAGALFVESYAASSALTGVLLAVGASTYVAGNLVMRRVAERDPRGLLFALASALAVATTAFGAVRPSVAGSTALFAAAAFLAGGRTFLSSAFGLAAPAEFRPGAMAMRAASNQFGYFIGSFAAGTALALGGYLAFGATIGALFLAAALVLRAWPCTGR
jgi:predicted MFS family arabinose efflux permease